MTSFERLCTHLQLQTPGCLQEESKSTVEGLVCNAWDHLNGSDEMGMQGSKIIGRTEDLDWSPPSLTFNIERHGATVVGSIYAEVQSWEVNIEKATAQCFSCHKRQLHDREKPIRTGPIAKELAEVMVNSMVDERIRWSKLGRAQVVLSKVFPNACKQTTNSRMRRLKRDLSALLEPLGWENTGNGWWIPPTPIS